MNSSHPDPRRVEGGSEQHFLTPLPLAPRAPGAPLANSKKLFVVDCFMNLTHLSVMDINYLLKFSPLSSRTIGFDVQLQPLSSIIVGHFYDFQLGSICPRMARGTPKAGKREPKGTPKGTTGAQRVPKGTPRVPRRVKRKPKENPPSVFHELSRF